MNDEYLDYECNFCNFKAKTPLELWIHQCDGKRKQKETKKAAIKFGQENNVMVGISV